MDPASAAALAANVVQILTAVSDPVVNAIKKRALRKALNKTVARVSLEFVAEFPGAGIAMQASSAPAIAAELRRLLTAGAPLEPQTLINEWMNKGYFEHADADRLATNYTERLHDALITIDGFRPLMVASATLTIAQRADEAERRRKGAKKREVARAYFDAADGYFRSALSLFRRRYRVCQRGTAEIADNETVARGGRRWMPSCDLQRPRSAQQTGMMFRTNLAENAGMLFVLPMPERASFWMIAILGNDDAKEVFRD